MTLSKSILSILSILGAFFLLVATGGVATQALVTPNFSYTSSESPGTGSADITIALISPTYSEISSDGEPFKSFKKGLEGEIMEALTAKGYSVRGPFDSRDEMLYSDKEASDLALTIDIQPELSKSSGRWVEKSLSDNRVGYQFVKGIVSLYGRINLTAAEPLSGEKMWAKSVSIPQHQTTEFTSSRYFIGESRTTDLKALAILAAANDGNVANPLTVVLEESFDEIMAKIWRHLDPSEFQRMKPKIAELKSRY
jgi:hypothetical protein